MRSSYKIVEGYNGLSLEDYLKEFNLGKPKIHNLFQEKAIFVNGNFVSRDYILKTSDLIEINYDEKIDFKIEKRKLDIIYEDDYLLLVNKPSNILVHPDNKEKVGTMANVVAYYYHNKGYEYSVKYAHRLDIDTTGILIFVKDSLTLSKITKLIASHTLKRTYLCLASGIFKDKSGTINLPIGEDRHHKQRRRVSKTGQEAITHYEVIKEYKNYSLVKVNLETGRTHQIRVHLSSLGHPLLGDVLYGGSEKYSRTMLHSYEVDFIHPVTLKRINIKKELPFDMKKLV